MFSKIRHNPSIITDFECKVQKYIKLVSQYIVKINCCFLLVYYFLPNNATVCTSMSILSLWIHNMRNMDESVVLKSKRAFTVQTIG